MLLEMKDIWKSSDFYFIFIFISQCYFSLMRIKMGNISFQAPKRLSTMTDVPCVRACVLWHQTCSSPSRVSSQVIIITHTDHQHPIRHPGGRFGCLALKSPEIRQRKIRLQNITTVDWRKDSLLRGSFK